MKNRSYFWAIPVLSLMSQIAMSQITVPMNGDGADIGAQINAAEAALPVNGGKISVLTQGNGQCYSFKVPIVLTRAVILQGQGPSTCLNFAGVGTAVSFLSNLVTYLPSDTAPDGFGLRDLTLTGSGVDAGQTGLGLGGSSNSTGFYGMGLTVSNFEIGLMFHPGVWNFKVEHSIFGHNTRNVVWPSNLVYGGENLEFDSVTFVGAVFKDSIDINLKTGNGGYSNLNSLTFVSCNFDDAQLTIGDGSGSIRMYSPHFENPQVASPQANSGLEPFVRISAYTASTNVIMDGPDFYNDQNNPYPPSFIELDGAPTVLISQMRSFNLDGSANVPTNLMIVGDAYVTLLGDAPLGAAKSQYIVASGNPRLWIMGGQDSSNKVSMQSPMMYSQTYEYSDNQSPVVQIGGSGYQPTIGFDLWTGIGSSFYGMQIQGTGPGELDFCTNGAGPIGAGNYVCNAGVVNGVFKSSVPDGTAPMTVSSHTPPDNLNAWPATFNANGTQIRNAHITTGFIILPAGGNTIVTFQLGAQFANPPMCSLMYPTAQAYPTLLPLTARPSPASINITGQPYFGVQFICVGN